MREIRRMQQSSARSSPQVATRWPTGAVIVCKDVVFVAGHSLNYPPFYYKPFLKRYLSDTGVGVVTDLRFAQAFRVLCSFALLEKGISQDWTNARIHPFTLEILHAEFDYKLPEIIRRT